MKLEELVVYKPKKVHSNFVDYIGFENEYFKVISRAPNGKNIPLNGIVCVKPVVNIV